ncbi:hypothetical protein BV25DRAFT_1136984 [Artomyces pyxidatus]|uniref:Uncharacterized protein n=1 Tax=Artomyces pyxidatus TaxID=48021 RepID=A0ACB8SRR0_9AGAM|nr:hypothetical protein BV25DRAFT_1136984 [Artomyces pyxidatus]
MSATELVFFCLVFWASGSIRTLGYYPLRRSRLLGPLYHWRLPSTGYGLGSARMGDQLGISLVVGGILSRPCILSPLRTGMRSIWDDPHGSCAVRSSAATRPRRSSPFAFCISVPYLRLFVHRSSSLNNVRYDEDATEVGEGSESSALSRAVRLGDPPSVVSVRDVGWRRILPSTGATLTATMLV